MDGFPQIKDGDVVIYDVETNGLDWTVDRIVGFVVTVERDGRPITKYFPTRHETGNLYDHAQVCAWVRSWSDLKIRIVGHNLKFDLHMSANEGIRFPNADFEDTGVNACLLDEHQMSYSLDDVSKRAGVQTNKDTSVYDHIVAMTGCKERGKYTMAHFWRLPGNDPRTMSYACADGDTTYYLWKYQQDKLDWEDLRRVWALECRVIRTLFSMERRGVPVDPHNLDRLDVWIADQIQKASALMPSPDFNVRSTPQMKAYFDKLGLTDYPLTEKGNASFKEDWLSKSDFGRAVVSMRKLTNLVNSFIQGSVKDKMFMGRIHANFNQMFDGDAGTITGRLSCTNPNMQQVPKRDKLLAPIFRRIFVPEPGTIWSQNDYSQQEYRVFATYTGAASLIEKYSQGIDMHQYVADKLGVPRDPDAKRLNLGMLYWMGVDKLADALDVSRERAKELREWYYEQIPEVKRFLYQAQEKAKRAHRVKTVLGRQARFPQDEYTYRAASRVIQGTCADLTKLKMVEVNEFLERETGGQCGVVLQIHDELDWFYPEGDEGERINLEAKRIMEDVSLTSFIPSIKGVEVPMKVDSHSAKDWGAASFPKQDWSKYD